MPEIPRTPKPYERKFTEEPTDELLNDLLRESLLERDWRLEAALTIASKVWGCDAKLFVGRPTCS